MADKMRMRTAIPAFRSSLVILMTIFLIAQGGMARSQDVAVKDIDSQKGSVIARTQIDEVDTQNGDLLVRHIDLALKGNAGLDIEIRRNYSLRSTSFTYAIEAHTTGFRWQALGPGWSMLVAPRWFEIKYLLQNGSTAGGPPDLQRLCSGQPGITNGFTAVAPYLELPSGEKEQLVLIGGGVALTKSNWRAECVADNLTINSPAGIKYSFGNIYKAKAFVESGESMAYRVVLPATKATDPYGNWISYEYKTACGLRIESQGAWDTKFEKPEPGGPGACTPTRITASDGRQVDFTYDANTGKLAKMHDSAGREWTYEHSADDALNTSTLTRVILPTGQKWEYTYNPGPMKSASKEVNAVSRKLATITYPEGGVVSYEVGLVLATASYPGTRTFGAGGERVLKRSLSTGGSWTYTYAHGGRSQYDSTTVIGPDGEPTVYWYMGTGYAFAPVNDHGFPNVNNAWQYGRLVEKWNRLGLYEQYKWQPRPIGNFQTSVSAPEPNYDEKIWAADLAEKRVYRDGNTYKTSFSNYDSFGNAGSIVESGPNGGNRASSFTYYNDTTKWILGKVKTEVNGGQTITRTFDTNARVLTETKDGVETSYSYDSSGNLASIVFPRALKHSFSDHKLSIPQSESQPGIKITRIVDDAGNVISETNGRGKTTTFTYDGLNRLTSTTFPAGNQKHISYSQSANVATRGGLIETTELDPFGRLAAVALGGVRIFYAYDYFGRRTFTSQPDANVGTTHEYDIFGRLSRQVNADGTYRLINYGGNNTTTVTDERSNISVFTYRSYGNPDERSLMGVASPEPSMNISLARNARDQVTSASQGGLTRTYTYDSHFYLNSVENPETGLTVYGRDIAGNMVTRAVGSAPVTSYSYDGLNRLQSITFQDGTPSVTMSYTNTHKLSSNVNGTASRNYDYDDNDNLIAESASLDGIVLTTGYSYNANDQLAAVTYPRSGRTIDYMPDVLGRPTKVGAYVTNVTYWPSGQIAQISYANGAVSTYNQNTRLWPTSFSTQIGSSLYANSSYGYDEIGNLASISDSTDTSYSRLLGYDKADRLVSVKGPWGDGAIAYDGVGNIRTQRYGASNTNYNYDGANRLSSISGERNSNYAYDSFGNLRANSIDAYTYDGASNLRCINCSNSSKKIEYGYDGGNQRVFVIKGNVKTYEVYSSHGNQLIEYTPSASNSLTEYIYLGGKRIAQRVTP